MENDLSAEYVARLADAVARRTPGRFYWDSFGDRWLTKASRSLEGIVEDVLAELNDGVEHG